MIETALYLLGLLLTLTAILNHSRWLARVLLFVIMLYIIGARFSPPEVDMAVYYKYLTFFSPYMIKEFLYYFVTSFLYRVIHNRDLVFIVIDFMTLGAVWFNVRKKLDLPLSAVFLALLVLSFVGVMGLQNVYRQFLSSLFVLTAFLLSDDKKYKSASVFAISAIFIHNAAVLLVFMLFLSRLSKAFVQKHSVFFVAGLIIGGVMIAYFTLGIRLKSNRDTGSNLLVFYYIIVAFAFAIYGFRATCRKPVILQSALYLLLVLPAFQISSGSSGGERLFMFAFPVFLYEMIKYMKHLKVRNSLVLLSIFVVFCVPTLLVYSSRQFIT